MKPKRYPYSGKIKKEPAEMQILTSKNGKTKVDLKNKTIHFQK